MFRNCKFCNKKFRINKNDKHISQKIKLFCSRNHKDKWNQKYNPKVIKAKHKAQHNFYIKNKDKIIKNYMKRYYIYHPRTLLTLEQKLQRTRLWNRNRKYRMRKLNNPLTIDVIQQVYEDNIKQFGTLTCYLCLKPIKFSEDSLEHKIPLSRSGTNEYNNLGIAHKICNNKKNIKTYEEYKQLTDTP